jgi:hypothetical protein
MKIRKLADKTDGLPRVAGLHPETGEKTLVDPNTGAVRPWPLLGIEIVEPIPTMCRVPMDWVIRGVAEGWAQLHNPKIVHKSGGPPDDEWRITHTFTQADYVTFHTVNGDIRYAVTQNPNKYLDPDPSTPEDATKVDWFYELELVKEA